MGSSILQIVMIALAGCAAGFLAAWLIKAKIGRLRLDQLTEDLASEFDRLAAQRSELADQCSQLQLAVEQVEAAYAERTAELDSALEKAKLLASNVRTLRDERENTKIKLAGLHDAFVSLRAQTATLQSEFVKSREFYKRELLKALQRRKVLEQDVADARAEKDAFSRAVESSVLEHGSEENMVMAAQLRLGQLDVLERTVNKLETENAQLRQDARQMKQEGASRERQLKEMQELKVHNAQLLRHVEALEASRQAHEAEAERYREQADESEKLSDTLRLRLDDLEKNFADMEREQYDALEDARDASVVPIVRNGASR